MKIALIQMTSQLDCKKNLDLLNEFLSEASKKNAEAAFLPEVFYSLSDGISPTPYLVEENNEHYLAIQSLAKKHQIALIGGSVAFLQNGKILNRALNFNSQGEDLGHYDKINLFSCDLPNKKISEGNIYTPGKEYKIINLNGHKVGLGICFDMRFSEMGLFYRKQNAEILTYSAAFTVPTGKAHWHTLLRARAIENQCFVIASGQWGHHNDKIQTYGHSLVIDPWGDILLDLKDGEKIEYCDLDFTKIELIRKSVIMNRE